MKKLGILILIFLSSLILCNIGYMANSLDNLDELNVQQNSKIDSSSNAVDTADWTYLIYLCGDNDLEPEAIKDLNEMESGFENGASVNVLVFWDRLNNPANLYLISNDNDNDEFTTSPLEYPVDWETEPNMGDRITLELFLNYAALNYPANHWGITFWNHGAGQYGVCFDDSTINETEGILEADGLEIEEILPAFENSNISTWEVISFDCCLMNLIEWVYEFENVCEYFVGSQESIPGQGFDYTPIIQGLSSGSVQSGLEFGNLIVQSYYSFYTSLSVETGYAFPTTIALLEMSKLEAFKTEFTSFSTEITQGLTLKSKIELQQYREDAVVMDYDFLIDLGDFLSAIETQSSNSSWRTTAKSLHGKYDELILNFKQTNMPKTTGISIFFPARFSINMMEYYKSRYSFANVTAWDKFLENYHELDHFGLQWTGLNISETKNHNYDGNLDANESGDLALLFTNNGDLEIFNPQFEIFIQNTNLANSSAICKYNSSIPVQSSIECIFPIELLDIDSLSQIVCTISIKFDLEEFSNIVYNSTIFILSDFDGIYLTSENSFDTAFQYMENSTFAGMMTSMTSSFIIEVDLEEYYFALLSLNHSEMCDFDLIIYGEDEDGEIEQLDSMETFNIPEVLGYDAYSNEIIWIEIVAYDGIGIFTADLISGDGFEYHKEPGSWLGNPIEVSSSTSFTASINGPGFGGFTYYLVTLQAIADLHVEFDLIDISLESGGMAEIYGIADDFLDVEEENPPFSLYYQNIGVSKEYVILIVMPIGGDTIYSMDITITKQFIAPGVKIAFGALAVSLVVLKVKKRKKEPEIVI